MNKQLPPINTISYERGIVHEYGFVAEKEIKSGLYDLSICHLVGADPGDIADVNPLRPTALTSVKIYEHPEQYVMYDDQLEASFSAVDYLLTKLGQRSAGRYEKDRIPERVGKHAPRRWMDLSSEQLLKVWLQAHREGVLPEKDPIPRPALIAAAVEQGFINPDELIENKELKRLGKTEINLQRGLPNDVYNEIVRQFESIYGKSPGRDIPVKSSDMKFAGVKKRGPINEFVTLFFTTDPREFETPFDTPKEQVEQVWELFQIFLKENNVEQILENSTHDPPKAEIANTLSEVKKKSTTWYPGEVSASQMYVGARINDIGRSVARIHNIKLDNWE